MAQITKVILHIFFFFFNKFIYLFIYLFIFSCVGSSFLCEGFLQLRQAGATLHCGARASHCRGLSCCGAQAPDAQAQQLWLTGPVAPQHVGSSQTRAQTHVPCTGRQTLNHCATREAPTYSFINFSFAFQIQDFNPSIVHLCMQYQVEMYFFGHLVGQFSQYHLPSNVLSIRIQ